MAFGKIIPLGISLILIGFFLVLLGSITTTLQATKEGKTTVKTAGIIFIGPFPLGWASDKTMFYALLTLAAVALILWTVLSRRL